MAAINAKVYNHGAKLTNSFATIYTVPALTQALVPIVELKNTDTTARTISIQVLQDGINIFWSRK